MFLHIWGFPQFKDISGNIMPHDALLHHPESNCVQLLRIPFVKHIIFPLIKTYTIIDSKKIIMKKMKEVTPICCSKPSAYDKYSLLI